MLLLYSFLAILLVVLLHFVVSLGIAVFIVVTAIIVTVMRVSAYDASDQC